MSQSIARASQTIAEMIHSDVKALFNFLYGTEQRSRNTVTVSLLIYGFYVMGTALQHLSLTSGACSL